MVSNYYSLFSSSPRFTAAYNGYIDIFTLPFNSFPCSILFVGIGKILAEKQFAVSNKLLWCLLFVSLVLLYVEFFITQHYCKVLYDDCFLLLPVTCTCIFMLIGQSTPCEINYDTKKLRVYSTIIYCCHGSILSWMHMRLIDMGIKEPDSILTLAMFLIAIALPILLGQLFMHLERRRILRWLRYSH